MANQRPQYAVGTVLALEFFDGTNTWITFLKVVGSSGGGTPKVWTLDVAQTDVSANASATARSVRPILDKQSGLPQLLKWYPSRQSWGLNGTSVGTYETIEEYDPEKQYVRERTFR